jgi:glycosyltransferase involved in cell wall biosynthesis
LSVGRLEANKGFHVLAEAVARLAPRVDDLRWVIVGDGPYRVLLERRIDAAGLARRVHWARGIDDPELHAWYEAADLFVHPTLYEGSSLVTLEAMAHRRPVIATRAGGLPDKVLPGTTGWLVPPGDAPALEHALLEALGARSCWAAFGAAARALVEQEFAWPAVAARLIDVYHAVLSDHGH